MSDPLFSERDLPASVSLTQDPCQVCWKNEANTSLKADLRTSLHFCKACLLPVHKACYGLPPGSEKFFFCDRCLESGPSASYTCEICQQTNGALKKVQDKWIHIACGISLGLIIDWETMTISSFEPKGKTQKCSVCLRDSFGTFKCGDCENRSHFICALRNQTVIDMDILKIKRYFCIDHILNHEKYCFCAKAYIEGQDFMIACDCCDVWYHGECMNVSQALGEKIEHYLCRFCDSWSKLKSKLERDDGKLTLTELPTVYSNLKLKDWLQISRAIWQRCKINLEKKCKIEEVQEALELVKVVPFDLRLKINLQEKYENSLKLTKREQEIIPLLKDNSDESLLPKLQVFMSEVKSVGVLLPNLEKITQFIENSQNLSQIKEILENSKLFTLTQVKKIFENMVKKFPQDLECLKDLKKNIHTCESWFSQMKDDLKLSQTKPLGKKLTVEEVKSHLNKSKSLPFSMQLEIRIVEDELKSADDWDKKYKSLEKPIHPSDLQMLLQETETLAVESQYMRAAYSKFEDYTEWVKKTNSIVNPSPNAVLPYIDQVKVHLALGESEISPYIESKNHIASLKLKIEEAEAWQAAAVSVIHNKVPAQKLMSLVRESKTIICQFPELETIEKRTNVNKKISEVIHKRHKEDELYALLEEGKEWNADDEFISALHTRIANVKELKQKVKETLKINCHDPLIVYNKLLEDLKNSKADLPDEKNQIEERLKSLRWLQTAKDMLKEIEETRDDDMRKKKKGEWDIIKNLVNKGEKIQNKDPQAEQMLQDLILKLWEAEYQRFSLCDEITLEQIKELEQRSQTLKSKPDSLQTFENLLSKINESLKFFEKLLKDDISQTLNGDLIQLKISINDNKQKLESYGMIFPERFNKVLSWDKWIDWCVETQKILNSKPAIDRLYEINQDALSLNIPATVPCLSDLNQKINEYENWLYKYTSYSTARKWFSSQNFEIHHYLKKISEKPKPSMSQIQELLSKTESINVNCEDEIKIMCQDLQDLQRSIDRQNEFFGREKYEDLLARCKKSYEEFKESEAAKEFYDIIREYCFKVFIEYEDLGIKLCSYEWNISGQRLHQHKGKISLEEWNDFFTSIEYLNKDYLDQATLERLKRQNALRLQIEEELSKIKTLESQGTEGKQMQFEVLEILDKQIQACKIILTNEETYVRSTLEKCKELTNKYKALVEQKAFLPDFKALQQEILNMPVQIPETSQKIKETIDKVSTLSIRARILKEHASKNRTDRSKVEQFLQEYQNSEVKLDDGENMLNELNYAKQILEEAINSVYDENATLETLNYISGKMNNMRIFMGNEEKDIKIKLWKKKLQLSVNQKVNYSSILGWFNEGESMKDFSMQEDLDRLELYVRKGEDIKKKLSECNNFEEIQKIETEIENLPFDLSHAVIEHKTRVSLSKNVKETKTVEVSNEAFLDGIENRPGSIKTIENALIKDPMFAWTKHPQKLSKVSQRIEDIIYRNSQGSGYKKSVSNMANIIVSLQDYGGFSEKIYKGEITPEELSYLTTAEIKTAKVIRRIFDGTPSITVNLHKSLLRSAERQEELNKKKKIEKIEKIEKSHPKKEISNLKNMIKSITPTTITTKPDTKPVPQSNPISSFSVTGLLSEVQAFDKKAQESKKILKKEEPKDVLLVSEKYRTADSKTDANKNPVDEWKELSKIRLERSGFNTADYGKSEELPSRRNRYDEYPEGKFSSDEEELGETGEGLNQEYNLMEITQKTDIQRRKPRKKQKLYDPFSSSAPKNKALAGSLLKIWTGVMEYGKHTIQANMFSVESIELFQKIPKLTPKLLVHGRTKQNELELYISQNASGLASRSIVTSWVEPLDPNEKHFTELVTDLKEKSRAAVIRIDNSLTIYLSAITDSFISFLNNLRININQKIDNSVISSVTGHEKLGCLIFYKKSSISSSALMDPEIVANIDPTNIPEVDDDDLPEKEEMSPITSGDDEEKAERTENLPKALQDALSALSSGANYVEILANLRQAIENIKGSNNSQDFGPNSSEVDNLISVIRKQVEQVEQDSQKPPQNNVQNVNQFLSKQFVQRPGPYMYMTQNYMYPPQTMYPGPYFRGPPGQMGMMPGMPPGMGQMPPGMHPGMGQNMPPGMGQNMPPGAMPPGIIPGMMPQGMPQGIPQGMPQNMQFRPPSPDRKYDDPRKNTRY